MPGGSVRRSGNSRDRQQHSNQRPASHRQLEQFARLPFQVYANRDAWWPPDVQNEIELLARRSLLALYLEIEPLCAWRAGRRVTAIVNRRYIEHWNEPLGQLIHFEALEDEDEAVAAMLAESVRWLRERGMRAARSGFAAFLDYPYAIDNYGSFPSFLLRGNPPSYHRYFKDAGFVTEKGQVDYTAPLSAEMIARYRGMAERQARLKSRFEAGATSDSSPQSTRGPT